MKKIITSLALNFSCFYLAAQIPNASFENWASGNPVSWITTNTPTNISVTQSNQAHAGTSSAKIGVYNPGSSNVGGFIKTGFTTSTITETDSLVGWYKSSFASPGDELVAYVTMYSGTTNIAYGTRYLTVNQNNYTRFAVGCLILMSTTVDSIQLNFIMSTSNSSPNINSYAIVDDLQFVSAASGINEQQQASDLSVFPNPASSFVNFTVTEKSTLEVYGVDGTLLLSKIVTEGNTQVDIADLPEGMLLFVLRNDKQLFRQKIVHQR